MKLVMVANTDWYLYNFRLSLARFLRANGYEVVLVSPGGEYAERLRQSGFRWVQWEIGRQSMHPLQELAALRGLLAIYRAEQPDFVHQSTIKPVIYGTLAARALQHTAVINSITGRGYVFFSPRLKARLLRPLAVLLYRLALRSARVHVIFENSDDRDYFVQNRLIPAERTTLISGVGTDVERFQPAPEPEGAPVILYAGRLLWDKGIGVLVEAARLLHQSGHTFRLVLAGESDPGNPASIDPAQVNEWVASGELEWWGFRADIEHVLAAAHIVTLPSFHEGVPTILMEAAASGRPIVASDLAGCRAVVDAGRSGLLVPLRDAPALAAALAQLIESPALRESMGKAGRAIAIERFTHQQINAETLAVYEKVTAFSPSAG